MVVVNDNLEPIVNDESIIKPTDMRFEFKVSFTIGNDEFLQGNPNINELQKWLEGVLIDENMENVKVIPIKLEIMYD